MVRMMILSTLVLMSSSAQAGYQWKGDTITVPLRGELPLQCSAAIKEQRKNRFDPDKIFLVIEHRCNAPHVIEFRVENDPNATSIDFSLMRYRGRTPDSGNQTSALFNFDVVEASESEAILMSGSTSSADANDDFQIGIRIYPR